MHAPSNAVLMLIGNKADLEDKRMVNFERAERLASQLGVSLYEVVFFKLFIGILMESLVRARATFLMSVFFSLMFKSQTTFLRLVNNVISGLPKCKA